MKMIFSFDLPLRGSEAMMLKIKIQEWGKLYCSTLANLHVRDFPLSPLHRVLGVVG
jgi:hypothetical protein